MKKTSELTYVPFGTQYYRAPSPHPDDWESDLKNIADHGFNMVKFWVQWRWNHPSEDRFDFTDIDRLMEIAERNKLGVMLNTIFDVAPAWVYGKFPDASMVTLSGQKIAPQTQPHRQIGGLGYCFNHDGIMHHFYHFLRETVHRYMDHPALKIWNVGSEPELTSSMSEMRRYADDAEKMGDMLCYCGNCRKKFKAWLSKKYKNITELNRSWNRNYQGYDEVELPRTRNTFNDLMDWRMFFVDTLGNNVKKRVEIAREVDDGTHPVMCHHVFIQGFPVTSTANDPWNVARHGDLHGFTQMDDPMMIDILRSSARGKPVISAEMLMLPGYTLDLPVPPDSNDVKRFIFSGLAGNLKGFIFWQYRPEILGREAPTWGLTTLDGKPTPWLDAFAETGRVFYKNQDFILHAKPEPAEIAIYYNPENQVFGWAATGNEKNVTDSLMGAHRAFYTNNRNVDFIHPAEITAELLERYRVIVLPFSYVIPRSVAEKLKDWVRNGGFLIGESYTAGWNREDGCHATVIPGHGLAEVFQAYQGIVDPVPPGETIEITPDAGIVQDQDNSILYGSLVRERLITTGAQVLARFPDGAAAVTLGSCGNGKALLIGTYMFLPYCHNGSISTGRFIETVLGKYTDVRANAEMPTPGIRVDRLRDNSGKTMLIFRNLESQDLSARVFVDNIKSQTLHEQFSGEDITGKREQNGYRYTIRLKPCEVRVYSD